MKVSAGHVVQDLQKQITLFNPEGELNKNDLNSTKSNQLKNRLSNLNNKLKDKLHLLYNDLLMEETKNVQCRSTDILSFLNKEYKDTLIQLNEEGCKKPLNRYNEWKIFWMLEQLNNCTVIDDEYFADSLGLPFTDSDRLEIKELKEIFCEDTESKNILYEDDVIEDDIENDTF